MAAMRGPEVVRDPAFDEDVARLRANYPEIDKVINDLANALEVSFQLPEMLIELKTPGAYAILVDYPPRGAAGLGQFLVVYHATDPERSMNRPYRTYTLLGIKDRRPTQ